MKTVKQILDAKGYAVQSVEADASVYEAIQLMAAHDIGALLVTESARPVGVFSERDYARKVILRGQASRDTPVREVMVDNPIVARPDQDTEECMAIMTERRVRHLPVVNGGEVVGIISIGDLVKAIIEDQRFTIEQLGRYISGEA
jgi:CBS domain-containing protein